ncbi:hypothetical protein FACS1894217_03110 [Clostridia bacterium]|nr:hypothetical protein FACS1894217_03110 [Clostridia bacterium]
MFRPEIIAQLKKVNISRDEDKTRDRLRDTFSNAKNAQKSAAEQLSGLKRTAIYRAMKTGNASARVVFSVAQVMDVSPNWLTGTSDERGHFKMAECKLLLDELGYSKLAASLGDAIVAEKPAKRKYTRRVKETPVAPEVAEVVEAAEPTPIPESAVEAEPVVSEPDELGAAAEVLKFADAVTLLEALYIRASAGGPPADLLGTIKRGLLS